MGDTIKMDNVEYDVIPNVSVLASRMLIDAYERAGRPADPFSKQGEQIMNVIVAIWSDLWPLEAKAWLEERREHLNNEMTISEQVHKQTGRSLASIPTPIYRLMRKVFPDFKLATRDESIKFVKHYPMFRMVNKI